MSVADVAAGTTREVPAGGFPSDVTLSPDRQRVYVTNAADSSLSIFAAGSMSLVKTVPLTHSNPVAILAAPTGHLGYVIHHVRDAVVSIVDLDAGSLLDEVPVDKYPRSGALAATGSHLYLVHGDFNQLVTFEVVGQTLQVASSVPLPLFPNSVAVTTDESTAFVALADPWDRSKSAIAKIDLEKGEVARTLPLPDFPARMALDAARDELYVAASTGISIIDTRDFSLKGTFGSGLQYVDVALGPEGTTAFVADSLRNEVAIFDRLSKLVVGAIPVGARPLGIDVGLVERGQGEAAPCSTVGAFPSRTPTASPSPTPTVISCPSGDCNGDGEVSHADFRTAIEIALLRAEAALCACLDRSIDGSISVDEIVAAVAINPHSSR